MTQSPAMNALYKIPYAALSTEDRQSIRTALQSHEVLVEALEIAQTCLNTMSQRAYEIKLEGKKDWDDTAGFADIYGVIDVIGKALASVEGNKTNGGEG